VPPELRSKLRQPLSVILRDLKSRNRNVKGEALEVLALRILIDLGLQPIGFRTRARETDYAETDLTADGLHLYYARWLVQCKNSKQVSQAHLTREIGLATLIRAHVILLITTGVFVPRVTTQAALAAQQTYLQVVLLDGTALKEYERKGRSALLDAVEEQAAEVLTLKRPQERVNAD